MNQWNGGLDALCGEDTCVDDVGDDVNIPDLPDEWWEGLYAMEESHELACSDER